MGADDTAVMGLTTVGETDPSSEGPTQGQGPGLGLGLGSGSTQGQGLGQGSGSRSNNNAIEDGLGLSTAGGAGLTGDFFDRPFVPRMMESGVVPVHPYAHTPISYLHTPILSLSLSHPLMSEPSNTSTLCASYNVATEDSSALAAQSLLLVTLKSGIDDPQLASVRHTAVASKQDLGLVRIPVGAAVEVHPHTLLTPTHPHTLLIAHPINTHIPYQHHIISCTPTHPITPYKTVKHPTSTHTDNTPFVYPLSNPHNCHLPPPPPLYYTLLTQVQGLKTRAGLQYKTHCPMYFHYYSLIINPPPKPPPQVQGLKTRAGLQYNGVTGVVVTSTNGGGSDGASDSTTAGGAGASGSASANASANASASATASGGNNNRVGVRLDAPYSGKVLSCKVEHLIYVEDEDDDDDEDDEDDDDEDEDDEGEGRDGRRKGDVARAARLLGISLPQLGDMSYYHIMPYQPIY